MNRISPAVLIFHWPTTTAKKGDKEKSYQELKKAFENPDLDIDTKINILLSYYVLTEVNKELTSQALELTEILFVVIRKKEKRTPCTQIFYSAKAR